MVLVDLKDGKSCSSFTESFLFLLFLHQVAIHLPKYLLSSYMALAFMSILHLSCSSINEFICNPECYSSALATEHTDTLLFLSN